MQSELNHLIEKYPAVWEGVKKEILPPIEKRDIERLKILEKDSVRTLRSWAQKIEKSHQNPQILAAAQLPTVTSRMKILSIQSFYENTLRAGIEGSKPLSFKNRWISNRLFFEEGLVRKPVSMLLFKCLWPLVSQKARLLSLLNEVGIYNFYSQALVDALIKVIDGRKTIEIAAGEGSLTRFLNRRGIPVVATDDYSWSSRIKIPSFVVEMDAVRALRDYSPQVVICSWPPPDNSFEQEIFKQPQVETYILITSQHRYAAGDWAAYESQKNFTMTMDKHLSRLLLPPEANSAVYVFKKSDSALGR